MRTPIGRYAGALSSGHADDLEALAVVAWMEHNTGVDWSAVDETLLEAPNQAGEDN
ncbi:MAG: hypothetical protein ABJ360_01240 [Roseobacter sp.]